MHPPLPPHSPNLPAILAAISPVCYLTLADNTEFDRLRWAISASQPAAITRLVRGTRCRSKDSLMDEFAAAFQFPLHIGRNWDALYDALTDLSWLGAKGTATLLIAEADHTLMHADDFADPFFRLLKDALGGGRGIAYRVILGVDHSAPTLTYREGRLREKLKRAEIEPIPLQR